MRRIYLESFAGIMVFFILSMGGWDIVVNRLTPDTEFIIEDFKAEAFLDIINITVEARGAEGAIKTLQTYADKTRQKLTTYKEIDVQNNVVEALSLTGKNIFYDEDRTLWFTINESSNIYSLHEDGDDPLVKSLELDGILLFVFFVTGFALYCSLFTLLISYRIRSLEQITLKFADGDFSARASVKGYRRVGTLNQSFNHMANKVSGLITSNRALTNAVSHELRTPICSIQWQAEILNATLLSEEQKEYVASIIEDAEEMETIVEEQLYYARIERPCTKLNLQTVNINQWISSQLAQWNKETMATIEVKLLPSELCVDIDPILLKRAMDNLVRNAYRYATAYVEIVVSTNNDLVTISIHDDGLGIEEKHWPFLFDAFYSANESRNKKQSGHGLGLAIVKQIAIRHQAHVHVEHSPLGGACFRLLLPLVYSEKNQ